MLKLYLQATAVSIFRSKLWAILCRLKGTHYPQDEVDKYNKCQRLNASSHGCSECNDPFKRPTLHIAHSTVFSTGKGDDSDSLTLLESLRQKLASQAQYPPAVAKEAPPENEAKEEAKETDKTEPTIPFSEDDSIRVKETVVQSNVSLNCSQDEQLTRGPEPVNEPGDRRAVFEAPHLKSAHVRYTRYHQQCEQQNEADMLDEMAKRYLVAENDQVDRRLSRDMERFGLPINTSYGTPMNINVSWEDESTGKESKPREPPQTIDNPQYYENTHWCTKYFNDPSDTALQVANRKDESIEENRKIYGPDSYHNEMLPFNCCLDSHMDFDHLRKIRTEPHIEKLNFNHDDVLPLHELQCPEFNQLDLTVKEDKVEPPIEHLHVYENLPTHVGSQGDLCNKFDTKGGEPVTDMLNSCIIQDIGGTRFEYQYSRDYCDLQSSLEQHIDKTQAVEEAIRPTEGPETILHIQAQTIPKVETKDTTKPVDMASHANLAEIKTAKEDGAQKIKETKINVNETDTILQINSQPVQKIEEQHKYNRRPTSVTELVHAKVLEQVVQVPQAQKTEKEYKDSQQLPNVPQLVHAKVLEQVQTSMTEKAKQAVAAAKVLEQVQTSMTEKAKQAAAPAKALEQVQTSMTDKAKQAVAPIESIQTTHLTLDEGILQSQAAAKTVESQKEEQSETKNTVKAVSKTEVTRKPGGETIAHSCVHSQAIPEAATRNTAPEKVVDIPKTLDNVLEQLDLNLNLSLSELLRRVRARNRLQYFKDIRTQMVKSEPLSSGFKCPTDRPECPPPPHCSKPCPPPPKKPKLKCPPKPKCKDPPKCPPDPPKCPPDPPKCPPDPPKCPPEKKCPCPCPPPPKCPPAPKKCPCQSTDPNDPVTLAPHLMNSMGTLKTYWSLIRYIMSIRRGLLASTYSVEDPCLASETLMLNRVRDFDPWTPIPSWPFPHHDKKRKLQCPYHGCPFPKPGPVRPNCPELPCGGFPKRLT